MIIYVGIRSRLTVIRFRGKKTILNHPIEHSFDIVVAAQHKLVECNRSLENIHWQYQYIQLRCADCDGFTCSSIYDLPHFLSINQQQTFSLPPFIESSFHVQKKWEKRYTYSVLSQYTFLSLSDVLIIRVTITCNTQYQYQKQIEHFPFLLREH